MPSYPNPSSQSSSPYPPSSNGLPQFQPPSVASTPIPQGTIAPGTLVRVGAYEVRVERFLSEGGFAHVYLATSATPLPPNSPLGTKQHVLKRIAVPDKAGVEEVGKEVEVMKALRNHPKIVNFIEASVSELKGSNGGYEIYILMEWCAGGGIIDMMNTRLQNRLTETEILKIFSDTVEAVAHMHYQSPPLIHRDLKVENILLTPPSTYKLCDFGSTTTPLYNVPSAVAEIQALEAEINKTTTLQYRAPELVDVWGRKGFDEKVDIWALGVLLYKLCYYTTPFEENGPLAILSATYKIPPYPAYSNSIKGLIGMMLQEKPAQRPNIYQVHEQVCRLKGTTVKLENKYAKQPSNASPRPASTTSKPLPDPANSRNTAPSTSYGLPDLAGAVSPMRRGRPSKGLNPASSISDGPAPVVDPVASNIRVGSGMGGSTPSWPGGMQTVSPVLPIPASSGIGFGTSFVPPISQKSGMGLFSELLPTSTSSRPSSSASNPIRSAPGFSGATKFPSASHASGFDDSFSPPPSSNGAYSAADFDNFSSTPTTFSNSFIPSPHITAASSTEPPKPNQPSKMPAQLTGEDGPPLPRRPPSNLAPIAIPPEFVSRASQTSPHLMASFRPQSSESPQSVILTKQSESHAPTAKPPVSQLDLLGDDEDFAPSTIPSRPSPTPTPTTNWSITSPQSTGSAAAIVPQSNPTDSAPNTSNARPKRLSWVGGTSDYNYGAVKDKFKPTRPLEIFPIPASPAPSTLAPDSLEAKDRFPALESFGNPSSRDQQESHRSSHQAESWQPIVEKEDEESSDDEAAVVEPEISERPRAPLEPNLRETEDFAATSVPRNGAASTSSPIPTFTSTRGFIPSRMPISSIAAEPSVLSNDIPSFSRADSGSEEGDIDLRPALASIKKFAPKRSSIATSSTPHPPLLAPKPQSVQKQAAISSLVSRYETISTDRTGSSTGSLRRPPLPTKPAGLRRDSSASNSTSNPAHPAKPQWTPKEASIDHFSSRFPDESGLDLHLQRSPPPVTLATSPKNIPPAPVRPLSSSSTRKSYSIENKPRLPFKPVPPASSIGSSSRVSSIGGSSKMSIPVEQNNDDVPEKFVGVSQMKSRWEGMTKAPTAPAVRKEWKAI